jgi:hypothetical protein
VCTAPGAQLYREEHNLDNRVINRYSVKAYRGHGGKDLSILRHGGEGWAVIQLDYFPVAGCPGRIGSSDSPRTLELMGITSALYLWGRMFSWDRHGIVTDDVYRGFPRFLFE